MSLLVEELPMGVHIVDEQNKDRFLRKNWWQWRPIVEAIRSLNLLDDERLDYLSDGIGSLTERECLQIAEELKTKVLPKIREGERMLLDGTVTDVPDDGHFYREQSEQQKNYSVSYESLSTFIDFCYASKGLHVL